MPYPVCACDATRPLAMREADCFADASHICDSCPNVWCLLSDAVISRVPHEGDRETRPSLQAARSADYP
jgi:hypothetical protein